MRKDERDQLYYNPRIYRRYNGSRTGKAAYRSFLLQIVATLILLACYIFYGSAHLRQEIAMTAGNVLIAVGVVLIVLAMWQYAMRGGR